ncbi:hypothetical protein LTR64_003136 [Lithohypha guttulata]|uniref:uncharacterized protein n=1 Tax=Lithohypha guttulata TaxID=1690604 RepID=UPI002DDF6824|nr:hypothetical protein LTR51_000641 [Lithohypha guttulata]
MDSNTPTENGGYADLNDENGDNLDDLFAIDDGGFDIEQDTDNVQPGVTYDDFLPTELPNDQSIENAELSALLQEGVAEDVEGIDLDALNNRPLEIGEKAIDAVDYDDIGDDDLPDEVEMGGPVQPPDTFLSGIRESAAESDIDDLFGDGDDDLFGDTGHDDQGDGRARSIEDNTAGSNQAPANGGLLRALAERDATMTEEETRQWVLQEALLSREPGQFGRPDIDDMDVWMHKNFPAYDPTEDAPFWNRILPPKPATYVVKDTKTKKPRPIRPTKVTLDIEPDQKLLFATPAAIALPFERRADYVYIPVGVTQERFDPLDEEQSDDDLPNGLTNEDLDLMCTDFDTLSHLADEDSVFSTRPQAVDEDASMSEYENDFDDSERPIKKRRIGLGANDIVTIHQFEIPSFDDPERLTAKIAREVVLDLNDTTLLVEELDQDASRQRAKPGESRYQIATIKDRLARRFKTSNDASYNLLQQNQKKVRGQLTNMAIDHSIPAIRLQYPYYQVRLPAKELRNWHRKQILFKGGVAFHKVNKQKRKEIKNKPIQQAFGKTRDLSVADNSYALLLEYSEEHPVMLSQTGMGNKVVNYYRKVDASDTQRPKAEIGDTSVLMPEDKSPFNNFGHIDPGQATLAIYNSMYRAPIFKQSQASTDFLIVREVTGMNGQLHYLRNIDYQYVVGQELPSVQVPGPSARLVTTVAKNRLKAISFRIARRKKSHRLRVEEVTRHFPETNDMQNRQKMKEFMQFNKEQKEWEMRGTEQIPDEEEIQKTLVPEEICLLESMQVGNQYLHDSGYADDDAGGDDDKDDDEKDDKQDIAIERQLAPWKTTKNFKLATQGKAMLRLYGDGDPSGRGEAFSFIKTSMKGGFKAQGLSANENVASQRGKEAGLGGHTYNVARQQQAYEESIRKIWNRQRDVLSSVDEAEDIDEEGVDGQLDDFARSRNIRATPASGLQTPSGRRRDDETGTSFSKRSANSQAQRYLRIRRRVWDASADAYEWREVVESDPQVIKMYLKRKEKMEVQNLSQALPTGDHQVDALNRKKLEDELARLENNRKAKRRKKNRPSEATIDGDQTGADGNGADPSTPAPSSGGRNNAGTQRKCANCGQVGHIKTNKKSVNSTCKRCGFDLVKKKTDDFGKALSFDFASLQHHET